MTSISHHKMHLKNDYYDELLKGQKSIEFRALDEKRKNMKIGDRISFICDNNESQSVTRTIKNLVYSTDFTSLLSSLPDQDLHQDRQKLLSELFHIYQDTDITEGVIAIYLED